MDYNNKEELIGEFIDLMDTMEIDGDRYNKGEYKNIHRNKLKEEWFKELEYLIKKINIFMENQL